MEYNFYMNPQNIKYMEDSKRKIFCEFCDTRFVCHIVGGKQLCCVCYFEFLNSLAGETHGSFTEKNIWITYKELKEESNA